MKNLLSTVILVLLVQFCLGQLPVAVVHPIDSSQFVMYDTTKGVVVYWTKTTSSSTISVKADSAMLIKKYELTPNNQVSIVNGDGNLLTTYMWSTYKIVLFKQKGLPVIDPKQKVYFDNEPGIPLIH
jgi:hypothetical protein